MSRVVVVQTAYLGDMVMTTPLFRELRRARPDDRICVVATPTCATVLEASPWVDEVVVYDKRAGRLGARGLVATVRTLRRDGGVFAIVAAQRSHRTGVLLRLAGAELRIGFEGAAGGWAYNRRVRWRPDVHAVDRYLALSEPLGGRAATAERAPAIVLRRAEHELAQRRLGELGIPGDRALACIAPGSNWVTKRWSVDGYGVVARRLVRSGFAVVVLGTGPEATLCADVADRAGRGAVSCAGELSLRELAGVLGLATVTVANDSGPAHLAAAMGSPVVAVFGPTSPSSGLVPFGDAVDVVESTELECRPCSLHGPRVCPLGHFRCMRDLGADRVWSSVERMITGTHALERQRTGQPVRPG